MCKYQLLQRPGATQESIESPKNTTTSQSGEFMLLPGPVGNASAAVDGSAFVTAGTKANVGIFSARVRNPPGTHTHGALEHTRGASTGA